jgi:hypothetical protein
MSDAPKIEYPNEMNLRFASLYINVSEGRMRALVREEKVKGTKTEEGWIFQKADLDKYNAEPHARAGGGTRTTKAGKAFVIHVTPDKLATVKDALAKAGIELEQRYDYSKQRAYQAKVKAKKAAAKEAAKALPPKPVAVPGPGQLNK